MWREALYHSRLSKVLATATKPLGGKQGPWPNQFTLLVPSRPSVQLSVSLEMPPRTKCQVNGSTEYWLSPKHTACLHLVGQCSASPMEQATPKPGNAALENMAPLHPVICEGGEFTVFHAERCSSSEN